MFSLILVPFLIVSAFADHFAEIGKCNQYNDVPEFDPSKYDGLWYVQSFTFPLQVKESKCLTTDLQRTPTGFISNAKSILSQSGEISSGSTVLDRLEGSSAYIVIRPEYMKYFNETIAVVATDYDSFAVESSCIKLEPFSINYVWLSTRARNPDPTVLGRINKALKDNDISTDYLKQFDQSDCPAGI